MIDPMEDSMEKRGRRMVGDCFDGLSADRIEPEASRMGSLRL